jgi:hypothetical protein
MNSSITELGFDFHRENFVSFADGVDHIHIFSFAKDGMLAIQVRLGRMADKELTAARVFPGVSHRKGTGLMFFLVNFAFDGVARTPRSRSLGAAALDHKVGNNAMEI